MREGGLQCHNEREEKDSALLYSCIKTIIGKITRTNCIFCIFKYRFSAARMLLYGTMCRWRCCWAFRPGVFNIYDQYMDSQQQVIKTVQPNKALILLCERLAISFSSRWFMGPCLLSGNSPVKRAHSYYHTAVAINEIKQRSKYFRQVWVFLMRSNDICDILYVRPDLTGFCNYFTMWLIPMDPYGVNHTKTYDN